MFPFDGKQQYTMKCIAKKCDQKCWKYYFDPMFWTRFGGKFPSLSKRSRTKKLFAAANVIQFVIVQFFSILKLSMWVQRHS